MDDAGAAELLITLAALRPKSKITIAVQVGKLSQQDVIEATKGSR